MPLSNNGPMARVMPAHENRHYRHEYRTSLNSRPSSQALPPSELHHKAPSTSTQHPATYGQGHHHYEQTHARTHASTRRRRQSRSRPRTRRRQRTLPAHLIAAVAEFVGTFMFLLLAFLGHKMAVTLREDGDGSDATAQTIVFIALSYGFSLLVVSWAMYRISGGLFNPAITLALVITKNMPLLRGVLFLPAQLVGAIAAAAVVQGLTGTSSAVAGSSNSISSVRTTLAPGVMPVQGLFLEMFLTAMLTFTVLMLAAEKSRDTFIAPVGIGLALFVAEIAGVAFTGGSLNPARSLGPPVVARGGFEAYHWIYWVGPVLGALLACGFYGLVKWARYAEDVNPGQDAEKTRRAEREEV